MKILGSDYDGTLTVGGIDEAKCEAIRRWRKSGNIFGIVSGRGPSYMSRLRDQYPDLEMDFFAAYNGAIILDACGNTIDDTKCNDVSAAELSAALYGWGCPFVYVNGVHSYTTQKNGAPLQGKECRLSGPPQDFPYFHQVSVQLNTPAEAAAVTEKIRAAYGDRLNPLQNNVCIDIVASKVNKAYGLRRVAALFGGNEADIIAVGDNVNDLDMLKAFRSYAMENGVVEAKTVATQMVTSVTEVIFYELG